MKTYETILFQNRKYRGRRIRIKGWGEYLVASTLLSRKLLDEESNYISREAKSVDEEVFFYVAPHEFKLSDIKLANEISKSLL